LDSASRTLNLRALTIAMWVSLESGEEDGVKYSEEMIAAAFRARIDEYFQRRHDEKQLKCKIGSKCIP
jgi:hypothetical protein